MRIFLEKRACLANGAGQEKEDHEARGCFCAILDAKAPMVKGLLYLKESSKQDG